MAEVQLYEGSLFDVIGRDLAEKAHVTICDPPYEIKFLGAKWDNTGVAFNSETWKKVASATMPGGYVAAFGFNSNFHRLACGMEDAGLKLCGTMFWLHGQGMPKSNALLKPSYEPIVLARVPGGATGRSEHDGKFLYCPKVKGKDKPVGPDGEKHLTVKPLALMEWLINLLCPVGGTVLDPFAGSGSTGAAALNVGRSANLIELDPAHARIIRHRLGIAQPELVDA
jgi:DNA modification methylase